MEIPVISGTGSELNGTTNDVSKLRAELQQVGTSVRTTAIPVDSVALTPIQAIPKGLFSQAFRTLGQALQTGSLKDVQTAYRAFLRILDAASSQEFEAPTANRTVAVLADACRTLREAVQSGDLATAHKAYNTIRQIVQNGPPTPDRIHEGTRQATETDSLEQGRTPEMTRSRSVQQAYLALQQELREDVRPDPLRDTPFRIEDASLDRYSIFLLLAANRSAQDQPERAIPIHTLPRTSTLVWWAGINLSLVVLALVTGTIELRLASLGPALLGLFVIDMMLFAGSRAVSKRT